MASGEKSSQAAVTRAAERALGEWLSHTGCVRVPSKRRRAATPRAYKKGYEMRFVARNHEELVKLRQLLGDAGLRAGSPYVKGKKIIQPVYGKAALQRFQ